MSKWRYTLVGWLMWRLWKRRVRSKLGMRQIPVRRWVMIGVGVLALALVFGRVRRTYAGRLGRAGEQHRDRDDLEQAL
jgi:heme A synthase